MSNLQRFWIYLKLKIRRENSYARYHAIIEYHTELSNRQESQKVVNNKLFFDFDTRPARSSVIQTEH